MSNRDLQLSLLDFNKLFYDSSKWLLRSLDSSISRLKKSGNTLHLKIGGTTRHLLPTYMCSSSLYNAVHIDPNDSSDGFVMITSELRVKPGLPEIILLIISLYYKV